MYVEKTNTTTVFYNRVTNTFHSTNRYFIPNNLHHCRLGIKAKFASSGMKLGKLQLHHLI